MSLLALHDYEKQAEAITNIVLDKYPNTSPSFLAVILDYNHVPTTVSVCTISSLNPADQFRSVIQRAEQSEGQLMVILAGFHDNAILSTAEVPEPLQRHLAILRDGMDIVPVPQ
jgi:hypothetical protein